MKPLLVAIFLLALQAPTPGRLPLQGRVVKSGTNEPIARASIVVAKVEGRLEDYRTILTDEAGRFGLTDLTPGTYRVFASKSGYLTAEYGFRDPIGPSRLEGVRITLAEGQPQAEFKLSLIPGGAITGLVRDAEGKPMRNVWVRALGTSESAQTNDLGEYRVFDLPPGRYLLSASLDRPRIEGDLYVAPANPIQISGSDLGYIFLTATPGATALANGLVAPSAFDRRVFFPVFYPNKRSEADATAVELRAGATLAGIDFVMAPTPTVNVRGRVVNGVTGQLVADTLVSIPPLRGVRTGGSGVFDIPGVPVGRYELWTTAGGNALQAYEQIEVADRDVENVSLVVGPALTVAGRLTIDGRAPTANDPRLSVQLLSPPGRVGASAVPVQAGGAFSVANVGPGDYRFRVIGRNFFVKAARFGAADVMNAPIRIEQDLRGRQLDIDISLSTGVIEGVVLNENQQPVRDIPVVIVPDISRRNRSEFYKVGASDAAGRVRVEGVAPGEYKVFASPVVAPREWQDPAVIRLYESRGEPVRIEENGRREVTLEMISERL